MGHRAAIDRAADGLQFAGMFYNADSGPYLTQYRAYDPVSGRWLSRDPPGEISDPAANLYRYVNGDPIRLTGRNGRFGAVGAGIGAAAFAIADVAWQLQRNGGTRCFNPLEALGAAGLGAALGATAGLAAEAFAAEAAEGLASAAEGLAPQAPDFVVTSGADVIPVPEGATGPFPTNSPGFQFNGGAGGNGLASNVTDVRIMEPNAQNPTGYVNYGSAQTNGGWQSVNPYTGQSISPSNPWWHIPINTRP